MQKHTYKWKGWDQPFQQWEQANLYQQLWRKEDQKGDTIKI